MKWNGTRLTAGCRHEQGGMGMKIMTALILALAMVLAMLCATAEDSDAGLTLGESVQAADEGITIEDEAIDEDGMDLELADDVILNDDAIVIEDLSLDSLEDNLLPDGLSELESIAEDPANALAGNESNPEDFEIDEDGVLTSYVGPGGDVIIPQGVTAIGYCAFYSLPDLISVTIPDTVTFISGAAFYMCENLSKVFIGAGVTEIEGPFFIECSALKEIIVSEDNAVYICEDGILYTRDMKKMVACTDRTSITIPDSVTSIDVGIFGDTLTSVTIGAGMSLESLIKAGVFWSDNLTEINVAENNTVYASEDGVLYTRDKKALMIVPPGKINVSIPDSVTRIEERAFYGCEKLVRLNIPDSVTKIGKEAFDFCYELSTIEISKNITCIEESTFMKCVKLYKVTIPNKVTNIGNEAFSDCVSLQSIVIPGGVITIGDYAFYNCESLTNLTISEGVKSIGEGAFLGCSDLSSVTIPKSVTTIGKDAFKHCAEYSPEGFTIYGFKDTYAETYAKENGFKFSVLPDPISIAKAKVTVSSQVYTGKALKPAVTVKYESKTLKKGTDYTVSYKNNKAIGTATVTVTGKGDYTGTAKKTFKINPKAVSGLKLTAGKGRLTVSWKKGAGGIGGYQLQYGLKKSFSGAKKATVSKASTVKGTIKNLKKGKIYYVRIRAFKKVGKTTYWSAWSAAKKAKVK